MTCWLRSKPFCTATRAHDSLPDVLGREMLLFFMEEHGLAQSDLSEIGS